MGWRYKARLFPIAAVVIIWVTSAEFTQGIFIDYKQPFAVTYLGVSLMVVYLPIAFIKDWICSIIRKRSCNNESSAGFSSPLNCIAGRNIFEIELEGNLNKKNSEADLSALEEGKPLVPKHIDDADVLKQQKELTTKEIAGYGFSIAPLWFVTEIKWICPTAPTCPMAILGGFSRTAWFDVRELSEDSPDDFEGLDTLVAHIANFLSTEPADIKLGIGGFSMGVATALYSATCFAQGKYGNGIDYPVNLRAIVGLSGWLPGSR